MNLIARLSLAALLMPCIRCQAPLDASDFEREATSQQAVLNPGNNPPNCSADGVCELVCEHDPDCPDASHGSGSGGSLPAHWKLTGDVTPSGVSGVFFTDDAEVLGDANSSDSAVWAVRSKERSDEPCYLKVGTEGLNDASDDSWHIKDHCGPDGPHGDLVKGEFPDVDDHGIDDHVFVTQVSVCMDVIDHKVKGLLAVGEQLRSDGTRTVIKTFEDERNHCDHWSGGASCPAGQIATAVNAYFNGSDPQDLTAITLSCRTLTYEP